MKIKTMLWPLSIIAICYWVKFDGEIQAAPNSLAIVLADSTLITPMLVRNAQEPQVVYAVLGGQNGDGRFNAIRIDGKTGQQAKAVIPIGPKSGFVSFLDGQVTSSLKGLEFRRPTWHLLRLPDGGGAGFGWVDSQTGWQRLLVRKGANEKTLVTRWVFNSSTTDELRSQAYVDALGQYAAVLVRLPSGWMLYLFDTDSLSQI